MTTGNSLLDLLPKLKWQEFVLHYRVQDRRQLPARKSSAFRGALGHLLRDHAPRLYDRLFECRVAPDHPYARRFDRAPNPYIVWIPDERGTQYRRSDRLEVRLTLIGNHVETFPELLPLLEEMGGRGLGPADTRLRLDTLSLETVDRVALFDVPAQPVGSVALQWRTPLRLRPGEAEALDLPLLTHRLAERSSLLLHFHQNAPLILENHDLKALAQPAALQEKRIYYQEQTRHSSRQQQHYSNGGWQGRLQFEQVPGALLPLLRLGQHLHLGKATTAGMGKYTLRVIRDF